MGPRAGSPSCGSRVVDVRSVDPSVMDARALEPRAVDVRIVKPRAVDPRPVDPRAVDLRPVLLHWVHTVLQIKPKALCMLPEHSISWATSPASGSLFLKIALNNKYCRRALPRILCTFIPLSKVRYFLTS